MALVSMGTSATSSHFRTVEEEEKGGDGDGSVSQYCLCRKDETEKEQRCAHRKRYCFNMVIAVTTLTGRPCDNAWS